MEQSVEIAPEFGSSDSGIDPENIQAWELGERWVGTGRGGVGTGRGGVSEQGGRGEELGNRSRNWELKRWG